MSYNCDLSAFSSNVVERFSRPSFYMNLPLFAVKNCLITTKRDSVFFSVQTQRTTSTWRGLVMWPHTSRLMTCTCERSVSMRSLWHISIWIHLKNHLMETFNPYLRGFSRVQPFPSPVFIAIFRFWALGVKETQRVETERRSTSSGRRKQDAWSPKAVAHVWSFTPLDTHYK